MTIVSPSQVMSPRTTSSQRLTSSYAYRRQVDHSEREGLSSGLSSSMGHDSTEKPAVDRDKSHESGYEIQRQNSENEQIRTLLDWQREQILSDCQAEIRKTRIPG